MKTVVLTNGKHYLKFSNWRTRKWTHDLADATIFEASGTPLRLYHANKALDIYDEKNPTLVLWSVLHNTNQAFEDAGGHLRPISKKLMTHDNRPIRLQEVFQLNVLSYNIQECLNADFGRLSWDERGDVSDYEPFESGPEIRDIIRESNAHIIGLQECNNNDVFSSIDEDTTVAYVSCPADGGWRGRLHNKNGLRGVAGKQSGKVQLADHRCLVWTVVVANGREILFANVHVTYRKNLQKQNVDKIQEFIEMAKTEYPNIILVGDFNFGQFHPLYVQLAKTLTPVSFDVTQIDHVFVSDSMAQLCSRVSTIESDASDHLPVLATFTLLK